MPSPTTRWLCGAIITLGLALAVGHPADAYTQGPRYWVTGESTARYPRHAGIHHLSMASCGSQMHAMELRVDLVNRADRGYGMQSYVCGSTVRAIDSGYDTYGGGTRGHFMQVGIGGFYATLRDT